MLALTLLLGASACSSDDNADPPDTTQAPNSAQSSTSTSAATTTTEPKSEEDEVAEAYLKAKALFFEIGLEPDPDDPRLQDHFGEPNLTLIRSGFAGLRDEGVRAKYPDGEPPRPIVVAVTINGSSASVEACVVDNTQQVLKTDGSIINDAVVSKKYDVEMKRSSGLWRIVDGPLIQKWPDGDGCNR